MTMTDEVITTGVDDLLAYCKGKDKVAMQDAATVLNIPHETIQAWVDFLVEEKILGIEYKFTKPYIYINKETQEKTKVIEQTEVTIMDVRHAWETHAHEQQIPAAKLPELWRSHVAAGLDRQRDYFFEQAQRRHASEPEKLWQEYRALLLGKS